MPTPAAFRSPVACSHNPLHRAGSLHLLFWCPDWNNSSNVVSNISNITQPMPNRNCACVCECVRRANYKLSILLYVHTLQRDCRCLPAASRERERKNMSLTSAAGLRGPADPTQISDLNFCTSFLCLCGLCCLLSSSFCWFKAVCCLLKVLKYVLLPVRLSTFLFSVQTGRSVRRCVTVFRDLSSVQIMMKWVFIVGAAILQYPEPVNVWLTCQ